MSVCYFWWEYMKKWSTILYFQCCGSSVILMCLQKDMKTIYNLKDSNHTTPTKLTAVAILVLSSVCRSDLWHSSSWTFVRSCLEVGLILGTAPIYYVLWGVLWKSTVLLPEPVVVFLLPLNVAMLLYGSSWTCWTLAFVGASSSIWLMSTQFKLIPYSEKKWNFCTDSVFYYNSHCFSQLNFDEIVLFSSF